MNADKTFALGKGNCHLKSASGVHVGSHERHACPMPLGVAEAVGDLQRNLSSRAESAPLRPEEHVFELELDPFFEAHIVFRGLTFFFFFFLFFLPANVRVMRKSGEATKQPKN